MSSVASSGRVGRPPEVTKHHIVCRNGGGTGNPRILVGDVEPGSIVYWGIDDDMTSLVLANFASEFNVSVGSREARTLVLFGCFCDEINSYERGRLLTQQFAVLDTVAVVMEPNVHP